MLCKTGKVFNAMASSLLSIRISRDYPGRLAIVGNGGSCTYEDMLKGIRGVEKKLREMGVGKGSRVALWSCNCANWLIFFCHRPGGRHCRTGELQHEQQGRGRAAEDDGDGLPAVR